MGRYYTVNPKKDKDGLTPKQAKFVEAALEVGPKEAAKIAYPDASPDSQRVLGYKAMSNPAVLLSLSEKADSLGLHVEDGIAAVKRGLEAETMYYGKDGEVYRNPNTAGQLKAAELTFKIHGELKESPVNNTVNFMTADSLDLLVAKLNASRNPA